MTVNARVATLTHRSRERLHRLIYRASGDGGRCNDAMSAIMTMVVVAMMVEMVECANVGARVTLKRSVFDFRGLARICSNTRIILKIIRPSVCLQSIPFRRDIDHSTKRTNSCNRADRLLTNRAMTRLRPYRYTCANTSYDSTVYPFCEKITVLSVDSEYGILTVKYHATMSSTNER